MIADFLMRRVRKQREQRSQLAEALSSRLERERSLTVDDSLIASMGVDRRAFFRAVYAMVIQERMHMMAGGDGRILLMTNGEFHRFMLRRSGLRETEMRRREGIPAFAGTVAERAVAAFEEETVVVDPVVAEVASDLDWFNLNVAPEAAAREKMPDARQSLPDRRREPWPANEESGIHF
ncbi:MAG: hypothetical protein LBS30_07070 [Planctomycetota bacterium]|jgi:hypothetical protein|nr:hypothetical protein [Planctomycetota bacterium]